MLKINADHRTMKKSIRRFGKKLRSGGVGLFYFAGHGIQVKGRNFLIPIGADIEAEADIEFEAVDAARVLAQMDDAGNKLNIIILDACRDNPFGRSFRSSNRGLAKMDAPTGSILAYATSPGSVAADGQGRNGLYTSALLKHMMMPGLTIEKMFKQVRIDVVNDSGDKQVPWESSSLTGDFYFNTDRGIAVVKQKKLSVEVEKLSSTISKSQQTTMEMELAFWQSIQNSDNAASFEAYIEQFPNGTFAALAKVKIEVLERKKLEDGQKRPEAEKTKIIKKEAPKVAAVKPSLVKPETGIKPQLHPLFTFDTKNRVLIWHGYLKPLKLKNIFVKKGSPLRVWVNLPGKIIEKLEYIPLTIKIDMQDLENNQFPYFLINENNWNRYSLKNSSNANGDIVNIPNKRLIAGKNIITFDIDITSTSPSLQHYELIELSFDLR